MGGSWTLGDVWSSENDRAPVYQKDKGRQGPVITVLYSTTPLFSRFLYLLWMKLAWSTTDCKCYCLAVFTEKWENRERKVM